jgi:putative hydrolase of the HAD superfamily
MVEIVSPVGVAKSFQTLRGSKFVQNRDLAFFHFPIILYDRMEPFLPSRVGYTIIREPIDSRVDYKRMLGTESEIDLDMDELDLVIEYGIWWDWDIEHLYELEAMWVYLDEDGKFLRVEASWHGGYHGMVHNGKIPMRDGVPVVYSQPGKHAFAPDPEWFEPRSDFVAPCTCNAGSGGIHVTPLFEGRINKTPEGDELASRYLKARAFQPSFQFDKEWKIPEEAFVEWVELREWIPARVAEVLSRLEGMK